MKNWKVVFVTLILVTALNSEGLCQYAKLLKGQPNPFDTAVAVRIDRYRLEGLKLKLGNQLVDSLLLEIKALDLEIKLGDSINQLNTTTIKTLTTANQRKDSVNVVLQTSFNQLYGITATRNKWYRRPELYLGLFVFIEIVKFFTPRQ